MPPFGRAGRAPTRAAAPPRPPHHPTRCIASPPHPGSCIPVRYNSGSGGAGGVEVLLISSRGGKGWVFPKGGWEADETVEAAARRETVEEAGVRGTIEVRGRVAGGGSGGRSGGGGGGLLGGGPLRATARMAAAAATQLRR